jgi:hypothetical protein
MVHEGAFEWGHEKAGRCAYEASKLGDRGFMDSGECLPAWAMGASKMQVWRVVCSRGRDRRIEGAPSWARDRGRRDPRRRPPSMEEEAS